MQESHGHLQHLKLGSPVVESPGLWDGVEVAIQDRGLRPEGSTFPSWLLGMAVGVLFILFFLDSIRPTSDAETLVIEMPVRGLSTSIEVPAGQNAHARLQGDDLFNGWYQALFILTRDGRTLMTEEESIAVLAPAGTTQPLAAYSGRAG